MSSRSSHKASEYDAKPDEIVLYSPTQSSYSKGSSQNKTSTDFYWQDDDMQYVDMQYDKKIQKLQEEVVELKKIKSQYEVYIDHLHKMLDIKEVSL